MAKERKFKKRYCKYTAEKIEFIDYKEIRLLKQSLSERYRIMPRRLTGNSKKAQEMVTIAIKRARAVAFIPYIVDRKSVIDSPFEELK